MEKLKDNKKDVAPLGDRTAVKKAPKGVIVSVFILVAMFVISGNLGPDRRNTQATIDRGVEAHLKGDLKTARSLYLQALDRDPDNKFVHYDLGLIAQQTGNRTESEARYRRALTIDPYLLPAMYNLAVLKENAGENESAAELYRRVIDAHPDRAAPHFRLGIVLAAKLSRPEEGRAEILKAAELDPRIGQLLKGAAKPQPPQKR